jgi:23S rRNA pseudouridine1911/1915/1917 synthase
MATRHPAADRLDVTLRRLLPTFSRREVQQAIATGAILVNGRAARKGQRVGADDRVEIAPSLMDNPPGPAIDMPFLYIDEAIIVVDKPAGPASVARRGRGRPSVAGYLLARMPELATTAAAPTDAGLVHRLDAGTSGALLVARTRPAWQALRYQFAARRVHKDYLAIVHGPFSIACDVDHWLVHDRRQRGRMRVAARPGTGVRRWRARAHIQPIDVGAHVTVVAARLITGVTHQLRVQLAAIGHPIVGDALYGRAPIAADADERHFLHAAALRFTHPTSAAPMQFQSPLPDDFHATFRRFEGRPLRAVHGAGT